MKLQRIHDSEHWNRPDVPCVLLQRKQYTLCEENVRPSAEDFTPQQQLHRLFPNLDRGQLHLKLEACAIFMEFVVF